MNDNLFHKVAIDKTNNFVKEIRELYKKYDCKFNRTTEIVIQYNYCVVWDKIIKDIERSILK